MRDEAGVVRASSGTGNDRGQERGEVEVASSSLKIDVLTGNLGQYRHIHFSISTVRWEVYVRFSVGGALPSRRQPFALEPPSPSTRRDDPRGAISGLQSAVPPQPAACNSPAR